MATIHPEVAAALDTGRPVVALESTVYSELGLPPEAGRETLRRCLETCRGREVVPALTAVLDGVARVGLDEGELERIHEGHAKVAERDLPVAVGTGWSVGVTTVSATLALAAEAGIAVMATGGIGGVHRDQQLRRDVSADLGALRRHHVLTVCAGAKVFLDIGATLEELETLGVPVLGWRTEEFPGFYTASTGHRAPHRVDELADVVAIHRASAFHGGPGLLLAVPPPAHHALDPSTTTAALEAALRSADAAAISGPELTPHILAELRSETEGRSTRTNIELVVENTGVAADLASFMADRQ